MNLKTGNGNSQDGHGGTKKIKGADKADWENADGGDILRRVSCANHPAQPPDAQIYQIDQSQGGLIPRCTPADMGGTGYSSFPASDGPDSGSSLSDEERMAVRRASLDKSSH